MYQIDLSNTHWERIRGFVSEHRIDARWILKSDDNKSYGSLRIVSHPDLPPGYLRAFFTYVTNITPKSDVEKLKTIELYHIDINELEVYSIDNEYKTETIKHEAPFNELEKLFNVKIFE